MGGIHSQADETYRQVVPQFAAALARLAAAYEADRERQQDLLQDIHLALWQSFAGFRGECAIRTWVYRIAHNVAARHVRKERRSQVAKWLALEEASLVADGSEVESLVDDARLREKLLALIQRLKLPDRQIMHLYLEGLNASDIAEITQFSPGNVATKIHRLKAVLARSFATGDAP